MFLYIFSFFPSRFSLKQKEGEGEKRGWGGEEGREGEGGSMTYASGTGDGNTVNLRHGDFLCIIRKPMKKKEKKKKTICI